MAHDPEWGCEAQYAAPLCVWVLMDMSIMGSIFTAKMRDSHIELPGFAGRLFTSQRGWRVFWYAVCHSVVCAFGANVWAAQGPNHRRRHGPRVEDEVDLEWELGIQTFVAFDQESQLWRGRCWTRNGMGSRCSMRKRSGCLGVKAPPMDVPMAQPQDPVLVVGQSGHGFQTVLRGSGSVMATARHWQRLVP